MGGDGQALGNKRKLLDKQSSYLKAGDNGDAIEAENSGVGKADTATRWKTCAISLAPLQTPICFDAAGHLFSKQSVITYLLEHKANPQDYSDKAQPFSLRRLGDVAEVVNADDNGEIRCPLTSFLASSGQHDFVGLWHCGHVVSASALTVKKSGDDQPLIEVKCPVCEKETFAVRLVLQEEDAKRQEEVLHTLIRKTRKRKHSEV